MNENVLAHVPRPQLEVVKNLTGLLHFQCFKMAKGRRYLDVVVLKGAFELGPGVMTPAAQPPTIALADEPWDPENAGRSSLRTVGDAALGKPGTDVFVTGTARPPLGRAGSDWDTAVAVIGARGTIASQSAQVTGPRRWEHRMMGWTLSRPEPTDAVPIRYELAYGGAYPEPRDPTRWNVHEPNPSGLGHADTSTWDSARSYPAPQWQAREAPVTLPGRAVPLAGYGPIARPWSARRRWAGTYDEPWLRRTREEAAQGLPPDYPADFDERFFQCAHPSLACGAHLRGDEQLGLGGLIAGHPQLVTQLPAICLRARLYTGRPPWTEAPIPLDTVHVDLDAKRVHLCWRLALDPARGVRGVVLTREAR